jgi:hypothetical protein
VSGEATGAVAQEIVLGDIDWVGGLVHASTAVLTCRDDVDVMIINQ